MIIRLIKNKTFRKLNFLIALIAIPAFAKAQDINYPEDEQKAKIVKEQMALFTDNFKYGEYEEGRIPLEWLLQNYPTLSKSIYINGIKLYEALEEKAMKPEEKIELQEKILWLYDQRMLFYNDTDNVIHRKAYAAYKFFKNSEDKLKYLLELFDEVFKGNLKNLPVTMPLMYMDVIKRYQEFCNDLSRKDVLERYYKIIAVLQAKPQSEEMINEVDKILLSVVKMDCNEIADLFGFEHLTDKQTDAAKKFIAISLANKCTSHPMFLKASILVFQYEPTPGLAKIIAMLSEAKQDFDTAGKYLHELLKISTEPGQIADANFLLAQFYQRRDMKGKSRQYALKAAESSEYELKAYRLIGDLYFYSFHGCMQGKNPLADRGIYLAAYAMYKKAGDEEMMKEAMKQFPSAEDIHADNKREGDQMTVGCWINENVVIRKRPMEY